MGLFEIESTPNMSVCACTCVKGILSNGSVWSQELEQNLELSLGYFKSRLDDADEAQGRGRRQRREAEAARGDGLRVWPEAQKSRSLVARKSFLWVLLRAGGR